MDSVDTRYKCHHCKIVIPMGALVLEKCPQCNSGDNLEEMCPNDTIECSHDIVDGIAYCDLCGEAMCPICKCHDVTQISRVTGYLQEVDGWNQGKQQELKDRHKTGDLA